MFSSKKLQKNGHIYLLNLHPCGAPPCSLGLSATNQQYFSLTTNQPQQPASSTFFSKNKPAPAISHQSNDAPCLSIHAARTRCIVHAF
jgi:hypothetical protein